MIFRGNDKVAYRDPAAIYTNGIFYLFYTYSRIICGKHYLQIAVSESRNLKDFSPPRPITPLDVNLNYSSVGNVLRYDDGYLLCFQTYPRPNGEKYGNENCRLYTSFTKNFVDFTPPKLMLVKGDDATAGRMIDPFLLFNRKDGYYYCFFKQNGVSFSRSKDLETWEFLGNDETTGENVCVLPYGGRYIMYHSPKDGISLKISADLIEWEDMGRTYFFDSKKYDFSKGRISAGFVLDLNDQFDEYVMFYHASGPEDESAYFDTNASLLMRVSSNPLEWK